VFHGAYTPFTNSDVTFCSGFSEAFSKFNHGGLTYWDILKQGMHKYFNASNGIIMPVMV
jgi:hypothetical protein